MGKYSVKGSPEFDARIDADMKRIADAVYASPFSKHWKALVLRGGYGRGDGSPCIQRTESRSQKTDVEVPFDDYDLIVVADSLTPLMRHSLKKLGKDLSEELGRTVSLLPCLTAALPTCEFSLLNYEMKYGHRVIRGDKKTLEAMPACPPDAIPRSEGTRLLMNCGARLLDVKRRLMRPDVLTQEERQRFIRFLFQADLAFGDCALLLRGAYALSYTERKQRLETVDLSGLDEPRGLVSAYHRAVAFRERVDFKPLSNSNLHLHADETVKRYEEVFLWYERRRLNRKFQTLEKYAREFPNLGKEGSPLKNVLHNLCTFGPSAIPCGFSHPRLRLYAALPMLLTKHTDRNEISWLLHSYENGFEELCQAFQVLHRRFS